jgi:hypothetical protein
MSKVINSIDLTDTLSLTEEQNGFWLYDETRGMNLAMRAKTSTDAFVEALEYYQDRLTSVEAAYKSLKLKVDSFVSNFTEEDED